MSNNSLNEELLQLFLNYLEFEKKSSKAKYGSMISQSRNLSSLFCGDGVLAECGDGVLAVAFRAILFSANLSGKGH